MSAGLGAEDNYVKWCSARSMMLLDTSSSQADWLAQSLFVSGSDRGSMCLCDYTQERAMDKANLLVSN